MSDQCEYTRPRLSDERGRGGGYSSRAHAQPQYYQTVWVGEDERTDKHDAGRDDNNNLDDAGILVSSHILHTGSQ